MRGVEALAWSGGLLAVSSKQHVVSLWQLGREAELRNVNDDDPLVARPAGTHGQKCAQVAHVGSYRTRGCQRSAEVVKWSAFTGC